MVRRVVLLGSLALTTPSFGETVKPTTDAPGGTLALRDPAARNHDGFYLRMGAGIGYGTISTKSAVAGMEVETTYDGPGPAYEFLLGGTVKRGLVLGGGFVGQDISAPAVTGAQFGIDGAIALGAIGPFIDWFPDPHGGGHVGALLGYGLIGLKDDGGIGGALWAGYDFFVADQWSLGLEGRAAVADGYRNATLVQGDLIFSEEWHDSATTYELLFTALYH